MLQTDPASVEMFARITWKIQKPDVKDDWDLLMQTAPEILNMHKKHVRALMENDFDPERSVKAINPHMCLDDFMDTGKERLIQLAEILKQKVRDHAHGRVRS